MDFNDTHRSVLKDYSRPIVHIRSQVKEKRFGLVFGAGLSRGFNIPTWESLVTELAKDEEVKGEDVLQIVPPRAGLPYKTEMLFSHFKDSRYAAADLKERHTRALDYRIAADWREIVRKLLYDSISGDLGELFDQHPYFEQYLPLIKMSHMTVTYNFDDFIEQALLRARNGEEVSSRGFESVTNTWTQFRRGDAIIYHPNGVIPQNLLEEPSDRFVFTESSYAEQMIGIFAGDQAGLVNHLSKHSCLLIGLSLEDDTLRNVLMQAAHACPGNFHYYVHYLKPDDKLTDENRRAITLANFKVYNLVTLFLNDEEIRALGELLDIRKCPSNLFCDYACEHGIAVRFRFYVTGPLGVGKSTTINLFRNLVVLDEWIDERPAVLAKDWESLSGEEKESADDWIIGQFEKKNQIIRNEQEGIFLLDRGPLDPMTFTPDAEWGSKANRLLEKICPGHADWKVEDGRVILLQGDGSELALRMVITQRNEYTPDKLQRMGERLGKAYGQEGVIRFDTRGLTPWEVAKRVAEIIHLEPYETTCDLHQRLENIKRDGSNVNE